MRSLTTFAAAAVLFCAGCGPSGPPAVTLFEDPFGAALADGNPVLVFEYPALFEMAGEGIRVRENP